LGLGDEIEELEDQLIAIERKRRAADKEASRLDEQKMSLRNTMDNCDDEIEKWEALEEKLNDGKTVYAPAAKTRKRKRSSSNTDSEDEGNDSDKSDDESQSSDRGSPLTAEDIETKIQELKDQKKAARRGRSEIEAEVKELKTQIKEFKAEARGIEDNRSRICIAARNQYSKSAIQVDFAAGIKEVSHRSHNSSSNANLSYSWMRRRLKRRTPILTLRRNFATTRRLPKTCLSIVSPVEHTRSCLVGS
jgi:chromosome segregation ATPase